MKINEFIWWTFCMNIDTRKVWISIYIITVVCIRIILFATVDMWGNSNTSSILRSVQNLPSLFNSWERERNYNLVYFCNELYQYNINETWMFEKTYNVMSIKCW